jgi:hypothetical protein
MKSENEKNLCSHAGGLELASAHSTISGGVEIIAAS